MFKVWLKMESAEKHVGYEDSTLFMGESECVCEHWNIVSKF